MGKGTAFPFAAVVGQPDVKEALLIVLTNPRAGGVLIAGESGVAKSVLVRAMAELAADGGIVELPLNATEDMVFGHIDLEQAITSGKKAFSPGILARADGRLLYVDEINLLRREVMNGILDAADRGVNLVEREGISFRHESRFTMVGTMNPAEGVLAPATLDRFGLFVMAGRETNAEARAEIMRRVLAYDRDPLAFAALWREDTRQLAERVEQARVLIEKTVVDAAMMQLAAQYCSQANCAGHRAELYLLETAKAIAGLAGRDYLLPTDIERAACFVLPHRTRQMQQQPPPEHSDPGDSPNPPDQPDSDDQPPPPQNPPTESEPGNDDADDEETRDDSQKPPQPDQTDDQDRTAEIDRNFSPINLDASLPQDRFVRRGSGKRSLTRTDLKQGRYVRSFLPSGDVTDLAFDATLRAAAPYQSSRGGGCAINILKSDLRQKVREKRIGNTFLFVVDASGSMGARERMRAVKGAIFSLLQDAYQKRDQVGMIAFRRSSAEVLLPVTRSIDLAQKCLQQLPTGGKTPLAEGLDSALGQIRTLRQKDKAVQSVLMLVTDGRANIGLDGGDDGVADALRIAGKIGESGVTCVVIDTETDFIKLGVARDIAARMGAAYYTLQELSDHTILRIAKNAV
jgi:magnesium chelatase subunit D